MPGPKPTAEQVADWETRTTALGLLRFAFDYLLGARAVMESEGDRPSSVPYMLLAHSFELSLKAFLRSRGATLNDLRLKYGHDLPELYDAAVARGLGRLWKMHEGVRPVLVALAEANDRQGLRYIINGSTTRPQWPFAYAFGDGIVAALHDHVLRRTMGRAVALEMKRNRGGWVLRKRPPLRAS